MAVDEAFCIEVEVVLEVLDHMDYYQLLKLPHHATPAEIQSAFFRESRTFHPDRYFGVEDDAFKGKVLTLYKRLAEAYGVLKEPDSRALYDQQLAKGAGLRFDRTTLEIANRQSAAPEMAATTQQGRKFMVMGLESFSRGDYRSAALNFQFACNAEPSNEVMRSHLAQAKEKLAGR